jgi:hypothetical protein
MSSAGNYLSREKSLHSATRGQALTKLFDANRSSWARINDFECDVVPYERFSKKDFLLTDASQPNASSSVSETPSLADEIISILSSLAGEGDGGGSTPATYSGPTPAIFMGGSTPAIYNGSTPAIFMGGSTPATYNGSTPAIFMGGSTPAIYNGSTPAIFTGGSTPATYNGSTPAIFTGGSTPATYNGSTPAIFTGGSTPAIFSCGWAPATNNASTPAIFTGGSTPATYNGSTPAIFTGGSTPATYNGSTPAIFTGGSTPAVFSCSCAPATNNGSTPAIFTGGSTPATYNGSTPAIFTGGSTPATYNGSTPAIFTGGSTPATYNGSTPAIFTGGSTPATYNGSTPAIFTGGSTPATYNGSVPATFAGGSTPATYNGSVPATFAGGSTPASFCPGGSIPATLLPLKFTLAGASIPTELNPCGEGWVCTRYEPSSSAAAGSTQVDFETQFHLAVVSVPGVLTPQFKLVHLLDPLVTSTDSPAYKIVHRGSKLELVDAKAPVPPTANVLNVADRDTHLALSRQFKLVNATPQTAQPTTNGQLVLLFKLVDAFIPAELTLDYALADVYVTATLLANIAQHAVLVLPPAPAPSSTPAQFCPGMACTRWEPEVGGGGGNIGGDPCTWSPYPMPPSAAGTMTMAAGLKKKSIKISSISFVNKTAAPIKSVILKDGKGESVWMFKTIAAGHSSRQILSSQPLKSTVLHIKVDASFVGDLHLFEVAEVSKDPHARNIALPIHIITQEGMHLLAYLKASSDDVYGIEIVAYIE